MAPETKSFYKLMAYHKIKQSKPNQAVWGPGWRID